MFGAVVPDKGAPATADREPSVVLLSINDTGLPLSRERRDVRSRRSGQGSASDRRSGTQRRSLINKRHVAPAFAGATGCSEPSFRTRGAPATADPEPSVVLLSINDTWLPLSRERRGFQETSFRTRERQRPQIWNPVSFSYRQTTLGSRFRGSDGMFGAVVPDKGASATAGPEPSVVGSSMNTLGL